MITNKKKPIKRFVALTVLLAAFALTYSWTYTPHGRLNYLAAFSLNLLSFTYKDFQPDPNVDFRFNLPVNLIFSISSLLPKEQVLKTEDINIPAEGMTIPARIYWPAGTEQTKQALPVIVYYHGGGFVVGSVDLFDAMTRSISNAAKAIVISVDYRLSPAHPHPAAINDSYAALRWAEQNATRLGGDINKLILGGDSAGGNLAAVVAQLAKTNNGPNVAAQLLYYPVVDLSGKRYPSGKKFMNGYVLSSTAMNAFHQAYIGHRTDRSDPSISPLYAKNLNGLPPALILTAGFDPLTDAATTYGTRLSDAGVTVTQHHFSDMVHGFMSVALFKQQREGLNLTRKFLNKVFKKNSLGQISYVF